MGSPLERKSRRLPSRNGSRGLRRLVSGLRPWRSCAHAHAETASRSQRGSDNNRRRSWGEERARNLLGTRKNHIERRKRGDRLSSGPGQGGRDKVLPP